MQINDDAATRPSVFNTVAIATPAISPPTPTASQITTPTLPIPTPIPAIRFSYPPSFARRPVQPSPSSALRSDLPHWLAWFLHAVDLDDLPIPGAIFRRSFLSSPFPYWLLSSVLWLYNVTQQYNRIRNPSLLAPHPHYQYTLVSLRRNEQCLLESWMAAAALLFCGLCILLLSVAVLSTGPYVPLTARSWRDEQRDEQQEAHRKELDELQRQQQRQQSLVQRSAAATSTAGRPSAQRSGVSGLRVEEDAASADRHPGNWPCIAVLAVLLFFFWGLRHMATLKWPQYRHGSLLNGFRY